MHKSFKNFKGEKYSSEEFENLTNKEFKTLEDNELENLTNEEFKTLEDNELKNLTNEEFKPSKDNELESLTNEDINYLTDRKNKDQNETSPVSKNLFKTSSKNCPIQ